MKNSIIELMTKLKIARIMPVALTLIVGAIILAAIVTVIRVAFFPNTATNSSQTTTYTGRTELLSSDTGSGVKMIVRGAIVADEKFRTYQIEISPTIRKISSTTGYNGEPVVADSKPNSVAAYEQFVYALDKANLVKGDEFTGSNNDLRGICATGRLYIFQVLSNSSVVKELWTSTCEGSPGSLQANLEQITNLFYTQLPGSSVTISKLWQ